MCATASQFYVGSEDPNTGPHTSIENSLSTEPSPLLILNTLLLLVS